MNQQIFSSATMKRILLLIGIITSGVFTNTGFAQNSCHRIAPESCYKVRKTNYKGNDGKLYNQTWHNDSSTPHCVEHNVNAPNDTIKLEPTVCDYMKTKNPNSTVFANCNKVKVLDIQNIIKPWHLHTDRTNGPQLPQQSKIWPDANWSLTKQDYNDYYTHPNDASKNFSVGALDTNFWYSTPTSRLTLDCDMNKTDMLNDGFYGYCTRMALQLYLNETCTNYIPPPPKKNRYVFGRQPGDQPLIETGENDPFPYGFTVAVEEKDQIRMCVNNKITAVLISFSEDGKPERGDGKLAEICGNNFLKVDGECSITKIKETVAQQHPDVGSSTKALDTYGPMDGSTNAQQQIFKKHLSSLLVKGCIYGDLVIGRDDDGWDLLLEKPTKPDEIENLTKIPGDDSINNYGFAPNGTIEFCHEDTANKTFKRHKATLFVTPTNDGKISFTKGAGRYVCEQMNLNKTTCTLKAMHTFLAEKVYKDIAPPMAEYPDNQDASKTRRTVDHYLIAFDELLKHTPDVVPLSADKTITKNNNVFKKELSQYLTANCRDNMEGAPPGDRSTKKYTLDYCAGPDKPREELTFWYSPNDKLLSGSLCKKIDDTFKGLAAAIATVKNSPLAQKEPYKTQVASYIIPIPPENFLLANDSCRLEDFQREIGIDDGEPGEEAGQYYYFKGVQLAQIRQLYQEHKDRYGETAQQKNDQITMALDWLSANAFAETKHKFLKSIDHPVNKGVLDDGTIGVLKNLIQYECPAPCVPDGYRDPYADFQFPNPCPINGSFHDCMANRLQNEKFCGENCAPGYIKNKEGICVSEDFFGWQSDHLRPKYLIGANWDDYEYKGDARDITYWGQRFGAKAINFLAITTVLFAMIAVLRLVLSGGASEQVTNFKKMAQWSAIALIAAIFAYVIVKTVISMTYWG